MTDDDDQAAELRPYPRDKLIESARAAEAELVRRARALDDRGWSGDLDDAEEVDDDDPAEDVDGDG
jgi:hypothetical protein